MVLTYEPVNTIVKVVIVLTKIVSINTPVIAINPFSVGSSEAEAPCAIAAVPKPASLESNPRLTPLAITCPTVAPANALKPKADSKINAKAAGI